MFSMILRDFGYFLYSSSVFSMIDLKIKFFDCLHMVYFWIPEIEGKHSLSEKNPIRGHLRP